MTKFSLVSQGWQLKLVGGVAIFGTLLAAVGESVLAQIMPDNTLGAEGSVVTPNLNIRGIQGDRIDGGATRGANLFHSFQEFNVGEGRGAYFANPTGIENILTRVTGGNPSNIFGRLGVLGGANLFLLNPNGIVFGANASLDIQGSFLATTAERIQLGDSGYFSAFQPQTSSLLSVNPGALFFSEVANQPSSIINQGNLSTGQHLTLRASHLDLQGQLEAGGDLTLQAQDTVKVRNTVAAPFLTRSGGNLTIIGNGGIDILALNHPTQTPFVSGGNLSLISDGVISLDAHFSSGGSFSIQSLSGGLANFVSKYDPIISSNGDVDMVASYTGASLLVESKGNIRFGGDINITGPDTSGLPVGPDTDTLSTSSALILRSGQSTLAYGGVSSGAVPTASNEPVPAGITLGGNVTLQPFNGAGGIVSLLAASGNVSTQGITTNGGAINVNSAGSITTNGQTLSTKNGDDFDAYWNSYDPNSDSFTYTGSGLPTLGGGTISLLAASGNITTGNLDSYSFSVLSTASQGGDIRLETSFGSISTGDLNSYSRLNSGNAAQGGTIALTAGDDIHITGTFRSYSYSDSGNAVQGGAISLTAGNDIYITGTFRSISWSWSGNTGQGGAISLTASNAIHITGTLYSLSSTDSDGNAGQGGAIGLTAGNDIHITGALYSLSYSSDGNAGQGGAIGLTAGNDIFLRGDSDSFIVGDLASYSYSESGNAGQGGAISLIARSGNIVGIPFEDYDTGVRSPILGSFSISEQGIAGNGGNVALEAKNNVSNLEILTLSSDSQSGIVQVTGLEDLLLTNTNILTSKQVTVQVPFFADQVITLNVDGEGQSGDVTVISSGNLTFNNSSIQSDTKGDNNAGNVTISSPGLVTFNNSFIRSNTSSTGTAGSIGIEAGQGITLVGMEDFSPVLSVETSSAGQPGNIIINTPSLTLSDTARITATATETTTNTEGGGSITLNASTMNLAGVVGVSAETEGQTPAGTLTLQPYENQSTLNLTLAPQSQVSASTSGSGQGGNLIVQAPEAITIRGEGQLAVQTTGDGAAGELRIDTQRLTIADGATISASTSSKNPNGVGGNLTINATESFNLTNQVHLLAQSTGAAPAGNITIHTGKLTANNGTIATSSEQSFAGGITITASNIRLFGNSDITTRVNEGAGDSGDIDMKADSILAFDDSDILAFAENGRGGDINLDTRAFFGENYRPAPRNTDPSIFENNNRVDVNADAAAAANSGTITQPDTTFIQNNLTELPDNQIDTDSLLANSCIVRRNQPTQGSFTITGSGGLPQRPGDAQMSSFPTVDIETLPSDSTLTNTNPNRPWQKGDPIVEPQGVYRLPNGKLVLSRDCPQ